MEDVLVGPGTVLAGRYTLEREVGRGGMATVYLAATPGIIAPLPSRFFVPRSQHGSGTSVFSEKFRSPPDSATRTSFRSTTPARPAVSSITSCPTWTASRCETALARGEAPARGRSPDSSRGSRCTVLRALTQRGPSRHKAGKYPARRASCGGGGFRIARALSQAGGDELTTSGLVIGTPMYMSPEQISGTQLDGRSDIYSLGCVLHEMVLGEPPFKGPSPHVIASRQLYEDLPPMSQPMPRCRGHRGTIDKALAKSPYHRFENAASFADALATSGTRGIAPAPVAASRDPGSMAPSQCVLAGVRFLWWYVRAVENPSQPAWVLVSDFEGSTGAGNVTEAIRELVTAELDQSRHVATMPRQQLRSAMRDAGLPDSANLTPDRARELALRSSVRAILRQSSGNPARSVLDRGPRHRCRRWKADSTAIEAATDQDLVFKAQDLGRQIRRGLGDRRSESNRTNR